MLKHPVRHSTVSQLLLHSSNLRHSSHSCHAICSASGHVLRSPAQQAQDAASSTSKVNRVHTSHLPQLAVTAPTPAVPANAARQDLACSPEGCGVALCYKLAMDDPTAMPSMPQLDMPRSDCDPPSQLFKDPSGPQAWAGGHTCLGRANSLAVPSCLLQGISPASKCTAWPCCSTMLQPSHTPLPCCT